MRKRLQTACIAAGMSLVFAGCASQDASSEQEKETVSEQELNETETSASDADSTTEGDAGNITTTPSIYSDISEFSGELDFQYVYETDAQTEIGSYATCAYTADGKYYTQQSNDMINDILYFYDNATGQAVPVCGKSNCAHNEEGCDAFLKEDVYPYLITMWYYEDNLYIPMLDGDYVCLEKISPDGSTREKSGTICRLETKVTVHEDGTQSSRMRWPEGQLHRGYMYFTTYIPGDEKVTLYRSKLGADETPEELCVISGEEAHLLRIKPYGRYVLFQLAVLNAETETYDGVICAYDTESGDISRLCDNVIRDYIVKDNCLYYCDLKDNVYCKNLDTNETSLFYETKDDMELYAMDLFSTEDAIVYQLTNLDVGEVEKQYVIALDGTIKDQIVVDLDNIESEQQEDVIIQPYSFEAKE